jgi:hypothetical protein
MCGETPALSLERVIRRRRNTMFFAAISVLPVLAGLVAGTFSVRRLPADALAVVCVALGIAGAVVTGIDSETTDRASSATFSVLAGIVAALLVYGGWFAGRAGMRAIRNA